MRSLLPAIGLSLLAHAAILLLPTEPATAVTPVLHVQVATPQVSTPASADPQSAGGAAAASTHTDASKQPPLPAPPSQSAYAREPAAHSPQPGPGALMNATEAPLTAPASEAATQSAQWLDRVRALLALRTAFPHRARLLGLEGEALVSFRVSPQGEVTAVELTRSSTHELLDRAALAPLSGLRLPAPPEALAALPITVPVRFSLSGVSVDTP